MKEIKRTTKKENYILGSMIQQLYYMKSSILIKYKGTDHIEMRCKRCDQETLFMFLLGLLFEIYPSIDKDENFDKAVIESLDNLKKIVKEK